MNKFEKKKFVCSILRIYTPAEGHSGGGNPKAVCQETGRSESIKYNELSTVQIPGGSHQHRKDSLRWVE